MRCRRLAGKGPLPLIAPRAASESPSASSASPPDGPPPPSSPSSFFSDLPIARVIPECLRALERGHLVLEAPPGAGKTTALPLELLAADPPWLRGKALVVVEPRRLAATAAARRMVSLLQRGERGETEGEPPLRLGKGGCPIGYAVRGDARCSFRDARVVVVTPGVATRLLLAEFRAGERESEDDPRRRRLFAYPVGAVMLDEAHERSAEVDLLFALLAARSGGGGVGSGGSGGSGGGGGGIKVIFASATLGGGLAEKAAARLEGVGGGGGGCGGSVASIVRAPAAKAFPVAVRFAGPPRDAGGSPGRGNGRGSNAALASAAATEAVALLGGAGGRHARGDVLVFLPGVADIRATRAALEKLVGGAGSGGESGGEGGGEGGEGGPGTAEILQLHGGLPPSEQDRVLLAPRRTEDGGAPPPPRRRRRIILSTPVAESSLTVPGVTSVVDAGLSRAPRLDPGRGVEKLVTLPISRSSADQRAGRAGREAPGACVRLWSEGDHSRRAAAAAPEASRGGSDLAPLALALVAADSPSSSSSPSSPSASSPPPPPLPWLDEPHRGDLSAGLELLELLGLISRKEEEEERGEEQGKETADDDDDENAATFSSALYRAFELTPQGRQACALGAHPRLSRMLLCAARLRCPELGAVLAAVCSERDFVLRSNRAGPRQGGAGAPAPAPGASAVERVMALAGRGPLASSVDRRAAAGVLDAAMVLERQLRGVTAPAPDDSEEEEGEEEDGEPALDDGDGDGAGETLREDAPPQRLRRAERRLALARAAADAAEEGDRASLVGCLIASAYPDRVATRRARGGRDRSAAFVLGGGNGGGGNDDPVSPPRATAVLPAGARDPLLECPVLAVATLGTSAAAARSSSLIFLAAPLELGDGLEGANGGAVALETLRAIPGLLVPGERACVWVPSASRLVCSVRTRVGNAVVEERALDLSSGEVGDEEAGRAFAEAARRGGGLAALREPAASRAWRRLVARAAAAAAAEEEEQGFGEGFGEAASLADLGGEAASPAALEALLPALCKCRTAADLEAIEWIPLLSAALLTPEQVRIVEQREEEEAASSAAAPGSSSSFSTSSAPRGGRGDARGSPAAAKGAGKKKGRPKR